MAIKDKENKLNTKETEKVAGGSSAIDYSNISLNDLPNYIGRKVKFKTRTVLWADDYICYVTILGIDGSDVYVAPATEFDGRVLRDADKAHCAVWSDQDYNGRKCFRVAYGGSHYTYFYDVNKQA